MAKYLRPGRGTLANANNNNILLKKGEMFLEYPAGDIGMAPAKLMIGNGITQYTSANPVTADTSGSSTNSFAPALVHPVLYRPKFTDSNCATSSWTFNAGTEAINNIKPWIGTSNQGRTLPEIIGSIKQALVNHADSLNKLNDDLCYAEYYQGTNATTINLNDLKTQNKTYIFGPTQVCSNSPYSEGATTGNSYTLQVVKNEEEQPIPGTISGKTVVCTQIVYAPDNTIFNRHYIGYRRSQTLTDFYWTDWYKQTRIGYIYTTLSYNSSTVLKTTIDTSNTIYGNPLAAWVQLRVMSQTPYSSVKEIFVDGPFNGNASTFVVYANGSGFVNGHVLGVNVFWVY